jgi:hypothetical protein
MVSTNTRCFLAKTGSPNCEQLASLRNIGFSLDEWDITEHTFDGLPEQPPDCIVQGLLRPCRLVAHHCWDDDSTGSSHGMRLHQVKQSIVSLLAGLPDEQIEDYCKRWSQHFTFAPANDETFHRLLPFIHRFRPICRQALANDESVYIFREHHNYRRPSTALNTSPTAP